MKEVKNKSVIQKLEFLNVYHAFLLGIIYLLMELNFFDKGIACIFLSSIAVLILITNLKIYSITKKFYYQVTIFFMILAILYMTYLANKYVIPLSDDVVGIDYLYILLLTFCILFIFPTIIAVLNILLYQIAQFFRSILYYIKDVILPNVLALFLLIATIFGFLFGIGQIVSSSLSYGIFGLFIILGVVVWILEFLGLNK